MPLSTLFQIDYALQLMKFITATSEHILAIESTQILMHTYEDILKGECCFQCKLQFELEHNSKPVKQPVRTVPLAVKPKLKKESREPTVCISSMVVVTKNN